MTCFTLTLRGIALNKKRAPSRKTHPSEQEILFKSLYDFGPEQPEAAMIYRVRLVCELPHPDYSVPGLLKIDKFCFEVGSDMIESGERLNKIIEEWKIKSDNGVIIKIHHAKCKKLNELVHYVETLPSKWFNGISCPDREYYAMHAFIRSLPAYQKSPIDC